MRHDLNLVAALAVGCLFAAGCATPAEYTATITGTVSYRQRIALPANAVVEVKLVDVSQGEAQAMSLANKMIYGQSSVPVSFTLTYPRSVLQDGHQYAVQARILVDGRPWMVTDTVNHVIAHGRIARADVILRTAR